jgi:hypothetical protein
VQTPSGYPEIPRDVALDFAELRHILGMNGPLYMVNEEDDRLYIEMMQEDELAYQMSCRESHW